MKKIAFLLGIFFLLPFNALSNQISIVDINFLLKNSEKGKKLQKEIDKLNLNQRNIFEKKQKELRKISIQEMNKKKSNMIAKLIKEINEILINYSKEKNITTIIDKKNVIITKSENDITKDILLILNK